MESAQHAIIEYSMEQFGSKADFSDLRAVPLGHTKIYDENEKPHQLEVKVDLIDPCIYWILDRNESQEKDFSSLSSLAKYINTITFSDLCFEVEI